MLYVLAGSGFEKIRKRAAEITQGYDVVRFGEGSEPFENAVGHLGAAGLFSKKIALYLDRPDEVSEEFFTENLKAFADSETPVVAVVSNVNAAFKKKVPKNARLEIFETDAQKEAFAPSVFALADAFAKGDRKGAWVLYRRFIENGAAPEELHGTLAWQARTLVLASKAQSAAEAGLKPFVYSKAKSALAKLNVPPEALSRELVAVYHRARAGEGSLENLLEEFLLKKV